MRLKYGDCQLSGLGVASRYPAKKMSRGHVRQSDVTYSGELPFRTNLEQFFTDARPSKAKRGETENTSVPAE